MHHPFQLLSSQTQNSIFAVFCLKDMNFVKHMQKDTDFVVLYTSFSPASIGSSVGSMSLTLGFRSGDEAVEITFFTFSCVFRECAAVFRVIPLIRLLFLPLFF